MFSVTFERDEANGVHEAHLAINAIASANRYAFEKVYDDKSVEEAMKLSRATDDLLTNRVDRFTYILQTKIREKSREGILSEAVTMHAPDDSLAYLHEALMRYREATPHAVLNEMRNTMGNLAGLTRTYESVTAAGMIHDLEDVEIVSEYEGQLSKQPPGFGRVLFDDIDT